MRPRLARHRVPIRRVSREHDRHRAPLALHPHAGQVAPGIAGRVDHGVLALLDPDGEHEDQRTQAQVRDVGVLRGDGGAGRDLGEDGVGGAVGRRGPPSVEGEVVHRP